MSWNKSEVSLSLFGILKKWVTVTLPNKLLTCLQGCIVNLGVIPGYMGVTGCMASDWHPNKDIDKIWGLLIQA